MAGSENPDGVRGDAIEGVVDPPAGREPMSDDVPFGLLVESVEDYAIFMLDPGGRMASWNRGAARIKGYTPGEVIGRHFSIFYAEEARQRGTPDELLSVAERDGRVEDEGWRVRKDGSRFWASVVITAVRDEDGRLLGYGKVTRDLTERRRTAAILESITDAFFALDRDWRFTYVNRQAEALLLSSRNELIGRVLWEEFPDAVGSTFQEMYHRAADEQRTVDFVAFYPPLGRWFEVRAYPSESGLSVYFHDVTDRKRADEALRAREQELRTVLDVLPLPVFIADADGRVVAVNPAVREFWGGDAPSPENPDQYVEYRGWWPETGERLEGRDWALARALGRGEVVGPEEVEVETFDGERRTILNFARPVLDADEAVLGAVAVHVDITERKAHEEAERFLAEAGRKLVSSLDYEQTLQEVARLAISRVADWCVVYAPGRDGLRRLAVTARDDRLEAMARALADRHPPGEGHPARQVFQSGKPLVLTEVPDRMLESMAEDEAHLELLRGLGVQSLVMVPLVARDEVLGAIALGWSRSGRRYAPADRDFVERLADAAALAVDNTRLYGEARRRAAEESALRHATAGVVRASTIEVVIQRIADGALEATEAEGAFVERIDIPADEVVVVARAGRFAPPVGERSPYRTSVAREVIEKEEPLLLENADVSDSPTLRDLVDRCGPCSAMAVPLADAGEPIGALVLIRSGEVPPFEPDEAERARTFGELASLAFRKIHLLDESELRREELERVTESRAALMRGFSHDLKNPLGAADGFLSLLEDGLAGELSADQRAKIERVRALLRTALGLIDDLVELHRTEAGQIQVRRAPLDLRAAAKEMAEEYRPQAEGKGLTMAVETPAELPVIESDASRVRQVLGNLISNAVKYTAKGGVTIRVGQRDDSGNACLAVDVIDTGPGIPRHRQHLLFREFSRLEETDPDHTAGVGLGLAISQRVAAALGGTIRVESEEGAGSTFTLLLPRG